MRVRGAHVQFLSAVATLLAWLAHGLSEPARAQQRHGMGFSPFAAVATTASAATTAPAYGWPSTTPLLAHPHQPAAPFRTPAPTRPADPRAMASYWQWYASHPPVEPARAEPTRAGPAAPSRRAAPAHRTHDLRIGRLDMLVSHTDLRCHYHLRSTRGMPFHRQVRCDHTHGRHPDVRYTGGL